MTGFLDKKGVPLACEWVTIDTPDPLDNVFANSTRAQGHAKGAAKFSRGEGAWYGNNLVYFCCSNGGNAGAGQIWAYDPNANTVTLVVESESRDVLDAPDNITVGPDGRIYLPAQGVPFHLQALTVKHYCTFSRFLFFDLTT